MATSTTSGPRPEGTTTVGTGREDESEIDPRVLERLRELEAERAGLQRRAAELHEANLRKDEFLALLAHEMRNPLASVRNAASLLRLKDSDDRQLRWCREVIERQAAQLTRLVDDLLDVSRISQGKTDLRLQPLDVADVVRRAVETSRPLVERHRHELVVRMPDEPVHIHGDLTRLTQVVANLLTNAAKYQNEGGRIDLVVDCDGHEVSIGVRDRGIGIRREMLSKIFELFAQGERGREHAEGGLGIGLSLVKSLVEMHGGRVDVASEGPGHGSVFTVKLPRRMRSGASNSAIS